MIAMTGGFLPHCPRGWNRFFPGVPPAETGFESPGISGKALLQNSPLVQN